MSTSLLAELQAAFPAEPRPMPPATSEQEANSLYARSWLELTVDEMDVAWPAFNSLPVAEFLYYLPAYLHPLLNAVANPHARATATLALLTLPTELPQPLPLPATTAGEPLLDPEGANR